MLEVVIAGVLIFGEAGGLERDFFAGVSGPKDAVYSRLNYMISFLFPSTRFLETIYAPACILSYTAVFSGSGYSRM